VTARRRVRHPLADSIAREARSALLASPYAITEARDRVPRAPGLYAVHATATVWRQLGFEPRADVPLYVGKSEDDLVRRELRTHFAIELGRASTTGSSTVRRSLAALLRRDLGLVGVPRSLANPGHFSSFGLAAGGDHRLTEWMHRSLSLAVWPAKLGAVPLVDVERSVIEGWDPPLNLMDAPTWEPILVAARAAMTAEAASWRLEQE
jgi:hypothetical protein